MEYVLLMVSVLIGRDTALCSAETPYHYISQVAQIGALTVTPTPLFSPHDVRREGNGRTKLMGEEAGGLTSTLKPLFANVENNVYGDQALWYPVYPDPNYPGWVSLSQTPIVLYGDLPEGYAPSAPSNGDPLGYSFSYRAGDHTRQESSDGRGNFFSSFSFVPPADSIGLQPYGKPLSLGTEPPIPNRGVFPTERPQIVHIPSRRPGVQATTPPPVQTYKPATRQFITHTVNSKPYERPTARPLVGSDLSPFSEDDFTDGFNFESKKLHTTKVPQTAFTINHALSTNIQYNGRETSTKSFPSTGVRAVTILPDASGPSQASTQRSYQALSRSLPLAFSSRSLSVEPRGSPSPSRTEKSRPTPPPFLRRRTDRPRTDDELRSSTRRSTMESISSGVRPTTTPFSLTPSKSLSVIQKIPRKLRNKNKTFDTEEEEARPRFIDDLTVLAYSSDSANSMNNSIIQIKPTKENEILTKLAGEYLMNSSLPLSDGISKDGYMSGNKTYLGGLGLSSNIHH